MNSFINALSESALSKSLDSVDVATIQQLSVQYPYAAAIQLLYAKKLKETNSIEFANQLQKTFLYFNNPLFINYILNIDDSNGVSLDRNVDNETEKIVETPKNAITENVEIPPANAGLHANQLDGQMEVTQTADLSTLDDDFPPFPQFKIEKIDPSSAQLAFTPYHTIDYFAAQGIKLGEAQNNSDRFSTQLKSFTAWLKQMKRLPGSNVKTTISINEEKNIQQMAENSIVGKNADTESMAEVWAKQGEINKALEIYKKLSLQNPPKSAYFAAKIDHLKKQQ